MATDDAKPDDPTADRTGWPDLKEQAQLGTLKFTPDAAQQGAQAAADLVGALRAYRKILVDNKFDHMDQIGSQTSGLLLAQAFTHRGGAMRDVLDIHINVLTDMADTFRAAGKRYLETDHASKAEFDKLDSITVPKQPSDVGAAPADTKASGGKDFPDSVKNFAGSKETVTISVESKESRLWGQLYDLGQAMRPDPVAEAGAVWTWMAGQLSDRLGAFANTASSFGDAWTGSGASAAADAVKKYAGDVQPLIDTMKVIGANLTYTSEWMYDTAHMMPNRADPPQDKPSSFMPGMAVVAGVDSVAELEKYRGYYDKYYAAGVKNSVSVMPVVPGPTVQPPTPPGPNAAPPASSPDSGAPPNPVPGQPTSAQLPSPQPTAPPPASVPPAGPAARPMPAPSMPSFSASSTPVGDPGPVAAPSSSGTGSASAPNSTSPVYTPLSSSTGTGSAVSNSGATSPLSSLLSSLLGGAGGSSTPTTNSTTGGTTLSTLLGSSASGTGQLSSVLEQLDSALQTGDSTKLAQLLGLPKDTVDQALSRIQRSPDKLDELAQLLGADSSAGTPDRPGAGAPGGGVPSGGVPAAGTPAAAPQPQTALANVASDSENGSAATGNSRLFPRAGVDSAGSGGMAGAPMGGPMGGGAAGGSKGEYRRAKYLDSASHLGEALGSSPAKTRPVIEP
ncbi:hypothetical protein [Nocardia heshunensis]